MAKLLDNTSSLQEVLETINNLPVQEDPVYQEKTVTPTTSQQSVTPDSGYDGLSKVTVNAMPTTTQATPSITINTSGLITATATQTAGYVTAGSKSATKQLAFQAAKTITPTTASQVAVSSGYYTGGSVIVNAIPSSYVQPSGTLSISNNGTFNVKNYASAVVDVTGSGEDTSMEDGLIARTISGIYENNRIQVIGNYAFADCSSLTTVNLPVCTSIGTYAFQDCSSLTTVNLPACKSIRNGVFQYCSSLTSVNLPACTRIGSNVFRECNSLTSISLPACKTTGDYAFYSCKSLTTVNLPACTRIGTFYFQYCNSLTSVNLPACTRIGNYAFADCSSLTTVNLPVCTSIGTYAFQYCSSFQSIYLLASSVCKLSHSNAFTNTGIKSTAGSIFVPASLVASYKKATNWTYFSNRIFSYNG